jgi:hypothetical protein
MLEIVKTIGAFVGLLTGITYFYDRMAKGRPVASLSVTEKEGGKLVCIRISNPSSYDIAILSVTLNTPVFYLIEDLEVRSLLEGASGQIPYFMLKPGDSKELILAPRSETNLPPELKHRHIWVRISWRRGNATWLPQVPVCVWTQSQTIQKYGQTKR